MCFCAVPKLEPEYKSYLPIAEQVKWASERFGGKKDLLLLDNNVLASCQYTQIIDEIKKAGFTTDATFVEPNMFEVAIKNLRDGYNEKAYIKRVVREYKMLIEKMGSKFKTYMIFLKVTIFWKHIRQKKRLFYQLTKH